MSIVITLIVLALIIAAFWYLSGKSIITKFVVWSVLLLAIVGFAGVKAIWNNQYTTTPDFTHWEGEYRTIAADVATTSDAKQAAEGTPIEVEQYTIQGYPFFRTGGETQQRVDRCESCHIGVDNPQMTAENIIKDVAHVTVTPAEVPDYLNSHPKIRDLVYVIGAHPGKSDGVSRGALEWSVATNSSPTVKDAAQAAYDAELVGKHPYATFGCTTCHYGDGRELVQDNAHGRNDYWLAQLLPHKYIEAACAQCHTQYNAKTFMADYTLHTSLLDVVQSAAGDKYPDAATLTPDQIPAFLDKHPELKPVVNQAAAQLASLSTISQGEQLFHLNACWGCHKIEGLSKGNVGPELTEEGSITTTTAIARQLWDPRYKVNNCVMPYFFSKKIIQVPVDPNQPAGATRPAVMDSYGHVLPLASVRPAGVTDADTLEGLQDRGYIPDSSQEAKVNALVTFVYSQTGLNYSQSPSARAMRLTAYDMAQPPTVPVTIGEGKTLFETSGCYACHYRGDPNNPKNGHGGIAGPNLSWEGARHSQQWIVAHYVDPQAFVPKSIMPVFPFSDSQRAALSLYDSSAIPKGGHPVSADQDMPTTAMQKDDIAVPQVRYMTR